MNQIVSQSVVPSACNVKCKPSSRAWAVLLIDGLGYQLTFTCGLLLVACIWNFSLFFLLNAVISRKSPFIFQALVVLKPSVLLIGCIVACSARIAADRQTHRQSIVTLAVHPWQGLMNPFTDLAKFAMSTKPFWLTLTKQMPRYVLVLEHSKYFRYVVWGWFSWVKMCQMRARCMN
jgi:hypothetical protein